MQLTKEEKNTVISFVLVLVSIFAFSSVFLIPTRGRLVQSARLMPYIITITMFLLSFSYFVRCLLKARPGPIKVARAAFAGLCEPAMKAQLLSIAIIALYVFVLVPYIGYYISSVALIMFISLAYVRRIPAWISIVSSVAVTAFFYVVFYMVFRIPLL